MKYREVRIGFLLLGIVTAILALTQLAVHHRITDPGLAVGLVVWCVLLGWPR